MSCSRWAERLAAYAAARRATMIQASWRGFVARRRFRLLAVLQLEEEQAIEGALTRAALVQWVTQYMIPARTRYYGHIRYHHKIRDTTINSKKLRVIIPGFLGFVFKKFGVKILSTNCGPMLFPICEYRKLLLRMRLYNTAFSLIPNRRFFSGFVACKIGFNYGNTL